MDECTKYPTLDDFVQGMVAKLDKNSHKKTSWRELPPEALLEHLEIETRELRLALQYKTLEEAMSETCDIANFAFFIHDVLNLRDGPKSVKRVIDHDSL